MIAGTFDVSIDTPKLHRRGIISLKSEGASITGHLKAGELEDAAFTGACEDKHFTFEGEGDFPEIGHIVYSAEGEVWGNSLTIACTTDAGKIEIFGTRLSSDAGEFKSSHEYMMKASTGTFGTDDMMYSGSWSDGA